MDSFGSGSQAELISTEQVVPRHKLISTGAKHWLAHKYTITGSIFKRLKAALGSMGK